MSENRVELDPGKIDPVGIRKVKVAYSFSTNDKNMIADMKKYGRMILRAAGGIGINAEVDEVGGKAIHYAGTCRMSRDPSGGIVDENLKAHDFRNLYICDGSVFPTLPDKNMTLTIMALAKRLADHLRQI